MLDDLRRRHAVVELKKKTWSAILRIVVEPARMLVDDAKAGAVHRIELFRGEGFASEVGQTGAQFELIAAGKLRCLGEVELAAACARPLKRAGQFRYDDQGRGGRTLANLILSHNSRWKDNLDGRFRCQFGRIDGDVRVQFLWRRRFGGGTGFSWSPVGDGKDSYKHQRHGWQQREAESGFHGEQWVRPESSTPPAAARTFLGRFWKLPNSSL